MDIGPPKRIIEIEPAVLPCPGRRAKHRFPPSSPRRLPRARGVAHVTRRTAPGGGGRAVERADRRLAFMGPHGPERRLAAPAAARGRAGASLAAARGRDRHCKRGGVFHEAPAIGCRCGLHASQTLDILRQDEVPCGAWAASRLGPRDRARARLPGSFAYPQRLRLICQFCFWQRGPLGDGPTVVAFYPRDGLVPFCATHLEAAHANGMPPKRLLAAGVVDQRLREAYAVDLLAI